MTKVRNQAPDTTPMPAAPEADDAMETGPYVDGFSARTVVGALFVAFVMMPGSIYMGLVAGQSLGAAAEWVTIILFAELARRSFAHLRRQEVFVLFYVASGIAAVTLAHLALSGGPFASTIWHQYLLQAPETSSIAKQIPDWVVPPTTSAAMQGRNLAHRDWWWSASKGFFSPCFLIAFGYVLGRLAFFGLGYLMFRLTSDVERLPFPLAPIAAEGATALAESTERDTTGGRKRSWRWNVFSVGASLGIVFGAIYVLVPVVSGLFLSKQIMILPIPFVDFTSRVEGVLPASLISISFDAGLFLAGMVLPFNLSMGTFTAVVLTSVIGGPILLRLGAFKHWTPGNGLLVNQMLLSFDFWMSVSVGLAATVLLLGLWNMGRLFLRPRVPKGTGAGPALTPGGGAAESPRPRRGPSRERGDFPAWVAVVLFLVSTAGFAAICKVLVPEFPFWIVLVFGFVWTPLHSYISARLIGLTGMGLRTPFLRETAFILSGYKGVDIWFAPIPMGDYGGVAMRFRELELTRTKFTSLIKAELLMFPVVFLSSFLFWWFFWHLNQIPSSAFPFAARVWPVAARQSYLIFTANSSESPLLLQALNPTTIVGSCGVGLVLYLGLGAIGVPATFFYGLLGGVGAPLHAGLSLFLGALAGRFYFQRRLGRETWRRYVPVVAAGFSCGMGLAGMSAVALSLIVQCAKDLPF
ncbi:MAG: peptide transporter [Lentisphaeria bacterium]|nr:peptide transporter [Lentisphaeria bacterium]